MRPGVALLGWVRVGICFGLDRRPSNHSGPRRYSIEFVRTAEILDLASIISKEGAPLWELAKPQASPRGCSVLEGDQNFISGSSRRAKHDP